MQHLPTFFLFQFTPLREGRPACRSTILSGAPIFQFTPLREGRPALLPIPVAAIQISIHAPPRGATRSGCACSVVGGIFQFTPLREGRLGVVVQPFCGSNFNSRPSARGDDCPECRCYPSAISIHAPPRGATRKRKTSAPVKKFQFTPLREGRRMAAASTPSRMPFQFTPLREGRPAPPLPAP